MIINVKIYYDDNDDLHLLLKIKSVKKIKTFQITNNNIIRSEESSDTILDHLDTGLSNNIEDILESAVQTTDHHFSQR